MHSRLLRLARNSRLGLSLTILSGLLAGLLTIWQAWLFSSTVDGVFLKGQSLAQVTGWLRLLLVIIAGRAALAWVNEVSANAVAVRVKTSLRERLYAHIQALGPAYTRSERTGELTSTMVEGIEALHAYFSQYLPQLVITALVPISILIFVFPIDLLSGAVLLITAPLIPVFMILIGRGAEVVTKRQYETLGRLSAHFLDSLQGLTTLKLFRQSKSHAKNIEKVSEQYRDNTMQVLRITFLSALALELLTTISTAVIAVEIGLRLLYARMDFLQALFILILAPEFYLPLRMLGLRFHAGMAGTSAARRIFEILETRGQSLENSEENPVRSQAPISSIQISNLSFTYPGEITPALQNINLQIQSGQHIALVGPTGAGKSTLVNLLLGFIQPTEGSIFFIANTLTGTSIAKNANGENDHLKNSRNSPHSWNSRSEIAWVPQKPYLFHDTIAANIKLGNPKATDEQLISAAKAAYLHEFITSLPGGYQTIIGEGGVRLSGGQAQRLALARAFLKDALILILDEPTSSLDPETEVLLEESTRQVRQGKTVITIAHRLNTIFQADHIVVLDKGRIVEQGTHRELMDKKGAYANMVSTLKARPARASAAGIGELSRRVESGKMEDGFHQPPTDSHQSPIANRKSTTLSRLLSFLIGSWNWVALSVLLGALTIGSNVSLMGTSAWLISTAALHPSVAELGVAIVGVRFFGISRGIFRYTERLVSHNVTFRLLAQLRVWFYRKLEPLAPARLIDYRAGDLLSRVVGDIETLENFYVRVVSPPLVALVIGAGTAIFLASFYPLLAAVLIGFFLGLGLLLPLSSLLMGRNPSKALITLRADLNTLLIDGIQGLADILAYGRADDHATQLAVTGRAYGQAQKRMACISGLHNGLAILLTNLGLWLVIYLTIPQVTEGHVTGPMLASLALLTLASFEAVTPLPLAAQMWESIREAARRLFEIVDAEPMVKDSREQRVESSDKELPSTLELSNLSYTYPGQNIQAIQGISFRLDSGKSLAIVGPSGAGKSTIVSLLLRFWEYSLGDIRLGGESLHGLEQDEVRGRCAVVSQSSYLFSTSIYENLRLARPSASREEIEKAAKHAQIHEFIMGLPNGYETYIGEQGLRLSSGERQRLAIARALLKDAPILILDEPTANLDPLTEKQVLETLFGVMRGKTTLLITHRLVGLENVDEILVLDQGQIAERGTQAELLAQSGCFRRLWELQNRILSNEDMQKFTNTD
jgi:ATP-binding cassette subfamily C protein CydCD